MANLIITTECNAMCPFCFAQEVLHSPVQRMNLPMVERLSSLCAGEKKMQLLGGEPTLHPDVVTFVELLSRQQGIQSVWVVTNLMGPTHRIEGLLNLGRSDFLINIHGSEFVKDAALREQFKVNLALLKARRFSCTLGVTIFSEKQNFEYLYSLLREDEGQCVASIRVSPSVPTTTNKQMLTTGVGRKWLELVKRVHQICPEIRVQNDCPVINGCLFTPEDFQKLFTCVGQMCFAPCTGMDCPFDILPDGSVRFCFGTTGVPAASLPNIFAYPGIRHARQALHTQVHHWTRTLGFNRCDREHCDFLGCHGVCPAVLHFLNPTPNSASKLPILRH